MKRWTRFVTKFVTRFVTGFVRRSALHLAGFPSGRLVLWLIAALLLLPSAPAWADVGPKPSMSFTFKYEGDPIAIVEGQLIECEDETCTSAKPLEEAGPQRFSCSETECSSIAYGYADYHKLVITFADGTRESNVFTKKAMAARYQVTVSEDGLQVQEVRNPIGRLCCPSIFVTLVLETLVAVGYLRAFSLPQAALGWVPLASVFTLPVVWLGFPQLRLASGWITGLSEGFAVLFETGFLYLATWRSLSLRHALLLSLIMNAASFLAGMLM